MAAVHRYEGTVNQVMGDGIMALFGAPLAHEDHALRACYAALAMQAAMRRYTEDVRRAHGLEIRIRVGLNSGEVVVRAIGNDLHMDYSAVGQTTHLAARMEQLATPGTIRLTAATLRLVEGLVQVTTLGPMPVKGVSNRWRCMSWMAPVRFADASRRRPPGGSRALSDGRLSSRPCARRWTGPALATARSWRWWARRAWGSPAWCTRGPCPLHAGLAGAGECLGVVWQGYPVLPRRGPAQALHPRRRHG